MQVFDDQSCFLGEGPLWHPEEQAYYWFDIIEQKLMRMRDGTRSEWVFDEPVSALGWVDADHVLMATGSGLYRFDTRDGARKLVVALEADNASTRSNDGRADPQGGFWIGTMGLGAEPGAGAIYRFYRGEVRKLFADISIPNAISFPAGGAFACYCDSLTGQIMRQALDPSSGWPVGASEVFVDLRSEGLTPDGAVFDSEGYLWNAQWGASRVARYTPDGRFDRAVELPTEHVTCPAFGGPGLDQMLITTARQGLSESALAAQPQAGQTFVVTPGVTGVAENRVIL